MITQISVFLENSKGRLAKLTRLLGEAGIDLKAVSVADTTGFGILRAIVDDTQKARDILHEGGFHVSLTQVMAVQVDDVPGGLSRVLSILSDAELSVEYLYSFMHSDSGKVLILIHMDDPARGEAVLAEHHIVTVKEGDC